MDHADLSRSIAAAATATEDGEALLTAVCALLIEGGLPLWRVGVSMPALDAQAHSFSMAWTSDEGFTKFHTAHGEEGGRAFLDSPIRTLLDGDRVFGRWRLDTAEACEAYPLLAEFRSGGATDYLLHIVRFTPGATLSGAALSFATRMSGGFTDDQVAAIARLVPVLGLAMAKLAFAHTLRRTLGTYLGLATGGQVLGGRVLRGEGRTIWAAILLVDLRGFTTLTDCSDSRDVVTWLDEHLDALGEPVVARGGEILKFLGDGFLAVFPVTAPDARPCPDFGKALSAAIAARDANRSLNQRRRTQGLPTLEADLVLHFGEVVYGNVGTRQRLDFTVIGRAVNEASRIEKSCGPLDRSILVSDSFAARCRDGLEPVGVVPLRGLERPQQVWGLREDAAETAVTG